MNQKGLAYLYILLGALLLVLFSGGAYYLGTKNIQPQQFSNPQSIASCLSSIFNIRTNYVPNGFTNRDADFIGNAIVKQGGHCNNVNQFVDKDNKPFYIEYPFCWGNPPSNYQELQQKQIAQVQELSKTYDVIQPQLLCIAP